jgi:hypothetical protein
MDRNTDHDEDLNRRTWTGEAWLGVESMQAPVHGPVRRILSGTYPTSDDRRPYGSTKEVVR